MGSGSTGEFEGDVGLYAALTTYLGYAVLILFGHLRDFFGRMTGWSRYFGSNSRPKKGYAPLLNDWENFYTRRLYHRIQDCWNRPISGPPLAGQTNVVKRVTTDGNCTLEVAGADGKGVESTASINLGSYNYLGFADDWHTTCKKEVFEALDDFQMNMCSPACDAGSTILHKTLERDVAAFVGKPAAIVYNMGYGTNGAALPALLGKGTLVVSDSLNHTSIVNGARASGAIVRVFKHNDWENLEGILRTAVVEGQPRTHRPWRKIVVVVEGIYSMEGEIIDLPKVISISKAYKAYVYLDEAHSIGALGKTGRGVCEHWGVDPSEVDVLMGTFTKSFGAMGGYIAGSKELIAYLRHNSVGSVFSQSLAPTVTAQILQAFTVIKGEDGTDHGARKLQAIKDNANYFRSRLSELGVQRLGDKDSPIIPVMLYNPTKIAAFSREAAKENLAVVVVGFPATPVLLSRVRFCISAGHTREQLDAAIEGLKKVARRVRVRWDSSFFG